jgi:hypothetical protein
MKVVVTVKSRNGSIHLETSMVGSSHDKVAESNAGLAVLRILEDAFKELSVNLPT